jgi:hypothetical protein
MDRPTREQIDRARKWLDAEQIAEIGVSMPITAEMVDILVAATTPPPDVPRPANMAELAKLVAKELRLRPINAIAEFSTVYVLRVRKRDPNAFMSPTYWHPWAMFSPLFDNLSVTKIATLIQAEESKCAQEWAGDG